MNPKNQQPKKPEYRIPNTDVSQAQAVSATRHYLITGLIIFVIIAVGGYFINSLMKQFIHETNKTKAQDKTIGLYNQKKEDLEKLKDAYDVIKTKNGDSSGADRILKALPAREEHRSLLAMVENIANVSGVKLKAVSKGSSSQSANAATSPSGSTQSTSWQKLSFSMVIDGHYGRIVEFLHNTERSARVLNFQSMDLSGGDGEIITASLTMDTYWQGEADIKPTQEELK